MMLSTETVLLLALAFACVSAVVLVRAWRRGRAETDRLNAAIDASRAARAAQEATRWTDAYASMSKLRP